MFFKSFVEGLFLLNFLGLVRAHNFLEFLFSSSYICALLNLFFFLNNRWLGSPDSSTVFSNSVLELWFWLNKVASVFWEFFWWDGIEWLNVFNGFFCVLWFSN